MVYTALRRIIMNHNHCGYVYTEHVCTCHEWRKTCRKLLVARGNDKITHDEQKWSWSSLYFDTSLFYIYNSHRFIHVHKWLD